MLAHLRSEAWRGRVALLAASLALLGISWPAFGAYFLGEDFIYYGEYAAHHYDFWQAVFSPTDNIFFRPVFCAANLVWQFVLPRDPVFHHVRNYAFSVVNLALLYALLRQLRVPLWPTLIAVGLFAVSKVHLTAIGYINTYDTIISLTLLLTALLFWLRFVDDHHERDYAVALVASLLSIFTKDYGLVSVGVIAGLVILRLAVGSGWRSAWSVGIKRLSPLVPMVIGYLLIRFAIVGLPPSENAVYSPNLSAWSAAHKVVLFTATIGNLAFSDPETIGVSGLGTWLAALPGAAGRLPAPSIETALYVIVMLFFGITLWQARRRGALLIFPCIWIAAYFGPTLLTRNQQMYYLYEPLAGAAVLLALCLGQARRRLLLAWTAFVPLAALGGAISNADAGMYNWDFATDRIRGIDAPLVQAYRGQPVDSVTFLTRSKDFWNWALEANGEGPMVQELLHRPSLQVGVLDYADFRSRSVAVDDQHLVLDIDNGFKIVDPHHPSAAPVLVALEPPEADAGASFSTQPDGESALIIDTQGATPAMRVVMADRELETTFADSTRLTALVPAELLQRPGSVSVYVTDGITQSETIEFQVRGSGGLLSLPDLGLQRVSPPSTRAGHAFAQQADGSSAMSFDADNATRQTVVMFAGAALSTAFGNTHWVTATLPSSVLGTPGHYDVYLKDGTRESNHLEFVVDP